MACRTVLRCVFLTEPCRPFHHNRALFSLPLATAASSSSSSLICRNYGTIRARSFHSARRVHLNCSHNESQSSSEDDGEQGPPQEAVLKAISEVSKAEGRVGQTTNVVIGGTVADDSTNEWLALDQKVNSYPTVRGFTAIGTGGDDFVQAMVVAVESVIQKPIPEGRVKQKLSSRGKYVSVNIGPIQVSSSEQVQAVYNAMRRDERMKYFL
ncbi:Phosphoribosylformylglycinamidine synthase [Melia azedarach]|uniref:Phosphoribosylformylglycinamidine synthase n=2 Tax=Melia azedarach TaxID=155640 RepID=A0ACC1XHT4_MELAZ|nr:Phosphoribosylformylglycinamidine synthase [Melia azedarach]KAJ4710839.1 Phosphoribosylformylglycinamidine synthase [Melia azedarach]